MHDVHIYPSPEEQLLLEQKAAEHNMTVDEFVAWLLRQSLNYTDNQIRQIVKS